jgi:hypothetical protein
MTRRALFAALASLPFAGRFARPKRVPSKVKIGYPGPTYEPSEAMRRHLDEHRRWLEVHNDGPGMWYDWYDPSATKPL